MRSHLTTPARQAGGQFDQACLYRKSDLVGLSDAGLLPANVCAGFAGFATSMTDPGFPCTFARSAFHRDQLLLLFPGSPLDPAGRENLRSGLRAYLDLLACMPKMQAVFAVLNVLFDPEPHTQPLAVYKARLWDTLQGLHDGDTCPWPASVPTDPDDPRWSFCFGGVPFFVNMSCPAYLKRRSRNLGPSQVLVINPRDAFDDIAGADAKGTNVRSLIRSLVAKYDGQQAAPELGNYGDPNAREWLQYALPDDNTPDTGKCPLRIGRDGEVGGEGVSP